MRDGFFFRALRMGNSLDSYVGQFCNVENGLVNDVHSLNQGRTAKAFYGQVAQKYTGPDAEPEIIMFRWYRNTLNKSLSLIVVCSDGSQNAPSGSVQMTLSGFNASSTLEETNGTVTKNGGTYTANLSWSSVLTAGFVISNVDLSVIDNIAINFISMSGVRYLKVQTLPNTFVRVKYDKLPILRTPSLVSNCERFVYPDGQAYIVNTAQELADAIATITPPTQSQIFAQWGRFAGNDWYPSGTTPGGEAASWVYDQNLDRISTTVNSSNYIGFVSLEELAYYEFIVRMSSDNADDDQISMVIAYALNEQNIPCSLTIVRNNGGWLFPGRSWLLVEFVGNTPTVIIDASDAMPRVFQNPDEQGWAASLQTVVRVKRVKNHVTLQCSEFGSETLSPASTIEYDIPENSLYYNKKPYGVSCFSQQNSTYDILFFEGGLNQNLIWDVTQTPPLAYVYENGTWTPNPSLDMFWEVGEPRTMENPLTEKTYYLDGTTISQV